MQIWYIRLFGTLRLSRDDDAIFRFSTRKTGTLLAFLAFYREQWHTREVLCEMLWPEEPPEKSRARLRVALTSLRHQLEPPGVSTGSVIRTEGHDQVRLAAETVATDVAQVERALTSLGSALVLDEQVGAAQRIIALFTQPLLSALYDDWVISERERLSQMAVQRLITLARRLPPERGQELALHAAHLDPLAEEPLLYLLPLLARNEPPGVAQRAFQKFHRRCETALGRPPSRELCDLAAALSARKSSLTSLNVPPSVATPAFRAAPAENSTAKSAEEVRQAELPAHPPVRLPLYLTRFFGREPEREWLRGVLSEARLVTLTGPGGAGKTRLAVEAAREWQGSCWFVPIAQVNHAERLSAAVCDALGELARSRLAPDNPEALLTQAANALIGTPKPLLVLDNLEQIADAAGSLLLSLLERVPHLRLLITTRLRLHLPGEQELPLAPLPLPPMEEEMQDSKESLTEVARIASVALFLDRARASRPDYQITTRNRRDIIAVCQVLEGVPLAIELVAARSGTLIPGQMRANLAAQGSLRVAARHANQDDRHHSLYAAIDWSYRLLPLDLRASFSRLSVFRGGFSAEAVAAVRGVAEDAANEALARLRAHSLAGSVANDSESRFSLLESLRTFASEQLTDDERTETRQSHARWFAAFAECLDAAIMGADQARWLERIDTDLDNLRAALEYDLEANPVQAVQTAGALWMYWHLRGRPTEGRVWLARALAACPPCDATAAAAATANPTAIASAIFHRARALHGAGTLAWAQGEGAVARPLLDESLRLRREIGDMAAVAGTLNNLGLLAWSRQDLEEARRFLGESLTIRRQTGATAAALASSLNNLGVMDWERGDYAASRAASEEALLLLRESGDRVGEGHALNNLGNVALALSDFAAAETWYAQSLALKRTMGYAPGIAATLSNVGVAALYQDRWAVAAANFEESLTLYRELNAPDGIATQLRNLGQTAIRQGEWSRAFALLSESIVVQRKSDSPTHLAGNFESFAMLAIEQGKASHAARLLGAAGAQRTSAGMPLHPSEAVSVARTAGAAREALGRQPFDLAYHQGIGLTPDEAAELALTLSA